MSTVSSVMFWTSVCDPICDKINVVFILCRCTGPGDQLGDGGCEKCNYAQVSDDMSHVVRVTINYYYCLHSDSLFTAG
jgi:hypothetical protein